MSRKLHISDSLALPREAVTQTFVVYGGKGMGKTNFGSVFAEELSHARLRFSVIDPMGVWWGLRHSAEGGKSPGIELLILGGVHGDMPIEPTAGAVVADLVADESVNVLIDISRHANGKMWTKGERIRFVRDYFVRLYERQGEDRRPLMQVVDEAARFAPQTVRHGETEVSACLGAIASMVEEGRNIGVGVCLMTQRSARLNKDVAELADCMIAFRIVGPRSIEAVLDWFGEHIEKSRWKDLIAVLRKLPIGRALIVSPGWLEFEGEAQIRPRETFDSSATPKPGQKARKPRGAAAKPDLKKYEKRMAETIERSKENDPKALKQQIAELKRDLAKKPVAAAAPIKTESKSDQKQKIRATELSKAKRALEAAMKFIIQINTRNFDPSTNVDELHKAVHTAVDSAMKSLRVIVEKRAENFDELKKQAARVLAQMKQIVESDVPVNVDVRHNEPFSVTPPVPTPRPARTPRPVSGSNGDGDVMLGSGIRRCAAAIAQRVNGATREQLTTLTGLRRSTRNRYLQHLKAHELADEKGDRFFITQKGVDWLGDDYEILPTGVALQNYWLAKLPGGQAEIFRSVIENPAGISRDEISEKTGLKRSTRNRYIQHLQAQELVVAQGETILPSETLFE